jgi:hypothetical protein
MVNRNAPSFGPPSANASNRGYHSIQSRQHNTPKVEVKTPKVEVKCVTCLIINKYMLSFYQTGT